MFSQLSLKRSAHVDHQTLPVMMEELLSEERRRLRFTRFGASSKPVRYGQDRDLWSRTRAITEDRTARKSKLQLKQACTIRSACSFLDMRSLDMVPGDRALARNLSGRWRCCAQSSSSMSIASPSAARVQERLLKGHYGSRVLRCENNQAGAGACPVDEIDQDTNAAANIGTCNVRALPCLPRPLHLKRPPHQGA